MKLIKIIFCMLLVLSLTFSLSGCFSKDKVKEDKDGNVIIKDKDNDGNDVVIGEKKWDKSKMHGLDAPNAKLETSMISNDGSMYGFSKMKEKDAKEYIEKLKSAGFTYNSVTLEDYIYNGTNKDGLTVNFSYNKENESGSIMFGKGAAPTDGDSNTVAVIGDSDKKWDSSLMGGLPDPGVKVGAFWTADGAAYYNLEVIPSFTDYIEIIKAHGFTENIDESEIDDVYIYVATNSTGDRVSFSISADLTTIIFEKAD